MGPDVFQELEVTARGMEIKILESLFWILCTAFTVGRGKGV